METWLKGAFGWWDQQDGDDDGGEGGMTGMLGGVQGHNAFILGV